MVSALREPQRPQPLIKLEMKKTAIILFISFSINTFSQVVYTKTSDEFNNFHQNVVSAERMLHNDSALQAYSKFRDAFDNYNGNIHPTHYFNAAMASLKIKEEFKALDYIEKAINKGYEPDSNELQKIIFFSPNTKKEFNSNYKKWIDARNSKRNLDWENILYEYTVSYKKYEAQNYKDALRNYKEIIKSKECKKKLDKPEGLLKFAVEKIRYDSLQAVKLLSNITLNGEFPNLRILDAESCKTVRKILLNYDADKTNSSLNNTLFKALNDGYISPAYYAEIIDRRNVMSGLTPEFYEPITGYEKTIANVMPAANAKRKTIGLYNIILPGKAKKPATTAKPANGKGPIKPATVNGADDKLIYKY